MQPHWADKTGDVVLHLGDCADVLRSLPACSIDSVVTDPPAAVSFMGRDWDSDRGGRDKWVAWLAERMEAAARCLKPGGHLLVWSLPRTSHWTALALEDAGLEIRDCIVHLFGSGFPKSLDVSRAIDKAAGTEREAIGPKMRPDGRTVLSASPAGGSRSPGWERPWRDDSDAVAANAAVTAPATEAAVRWEGFGTALKPGQEMWWLARKPLAGTVAANVLEYGTGALNIDGCRVPGVPPPSVPRWKSAGSNNNLAADGRNGEMSQPHDAGRWPANILLTHSASCEPAGLRQVMNHGLGPAARGSGGVSTSGHKGQTGLTERRAGVETVEAWSCADDCPVGELDRQSGVRTDTAHSRGERHGAIYGDGAGPSGPDGVRGFSETGGASRFFPVFRYEAKAPASERPRLPDGTAHPTVKPLDLMRWLVRLITPPGGTVLDLYAGTGPTAEACLMEGFRCVLIEEDPVAAELVKVRLSKPIQPVISGAQ